MFFVFILLIALACVFVKLGALSVWVTVLNAALLGTGALVTTVAALFAWKVWGRRRDAISSIKARVMHERG
jgi:hypothetical protein